MRRWLAIPLLLLAAGVVRGDPPGVQTDRPEGRPLPLPAEEGAFHFVIFGDRTGGPQEGLRVLEQAVRDTNLLAPDLVLTVGDLIGGYNATEEWLAQMREFRAVMDGLEMPWFPVAGNHDVTWGGGAAPPGHHERDYETHFGPLWYWFGHKNAAFVVLYSDEGDRARNRKGWNGPDVNRMSEEQLAWLEGTLEAAATYDHVFVFLHHPRWIPGYYPGTNWNRVHDLLKAAGNVTAVFAGHIHRRRYEGERDGIRYYTLATTGGYLPFVAPGTGHMHHVDLVTVRPQGIAIATIPVGAVRDPREMTPDRWREVGLLRRLALRPVGETALEVDADGGAAGACRLLLRNPATRPIEVEVEIGASDGAWWFAPDRTTRRLAPGAEAVLLFRYARAPDTGLASLALPRLTLQVDYLAAASRVSIPRRAVPLDWRLGGVPDWVRDPTAPRTLVLGGRGACLAVPARSLAVPDGPFTVEGWFRPRLLWGRRALIAKTEDGEFALTASGGRPSFVVHLGGAYVTAGTEEILLEEGRWHHVAGDFDGRAVRLYVDGRPVAETAAAGARRRNDLPLLVGAAPDAGGRATRTFEGALDEVRLSRGARYAGEAFSPSRRFEPDEDTLLLLHLDVALGPFAPDHGPGGCHAVVRGPADYAPEPD